MKRATCKVYVYRCEFYSHKSLTKVQLEAKKPPVLRRNCYNDKGGKTANESAHDT